MNDLIERIRLFALLCAPDARIDRSGSEEFRQLLVAVAELFPRYRAAPGPAQAVIANLNLTTCSEHIGAFFQHVGFYENLPTELNTARLLAERLEAEVTRQQCSVTNLVILDGLKLPTKDVEFNGGRLVQLDAAFLAAWLGGSTLPGPLTADRLDEVAALETVVSAPAPPFGRGIFGWESPHNTVQRSALPWLNYLNLYDAGKCAAIGLYQRSDSLLHRDQFAAIGVQDPMWEPNSYYDDEADEWHEDESLRHTLGIDDAHRLQAFLDRLEAGRAIAAARTHRVETALRYFERVSEAYLHHQLLMGMDDSPDNLEDLIIDAVVGLEAIYIGNEQRGKGHTIANRASVVLQSDIDSQRDMRRDAPKLYDARNAILHGNARQTAVLLREQANYGEDLLRRSLVTFCMMGGDHERLAAAWTDPQVAQLIKDEVRL